jgi:hypothetical protein
VLAYSAENRYLTVVRREHLAASSNAAVLQRPASLPVDLAPSIRHALPWAADPVARVDPERGPDLVRVPDLGDLRVRALVALDPVVLVVAHLRPQKPDAHSALHRAAVRVVSSSTRRLKKGQ